MQKIISLFQRNYDGDRLVRDELVPGAEWVAAGEGVATRKWDGTCCMVKGGSFYRRFDAKGGKQPPDGFIPAQDPDPVTKHWPGWLLVDALKPADKWHMAAWVDHLKNSGGSPLYDGTYELVGPNVQGNPDNWDRHYLIAHGGDVLNDAPRDFEGIKAYLGRHSIEGIVWHHPDGRMVKIKAKDFGIKWPR